MGQRKTADFVDELMERAFALPAPEMPDFASQALIHWPTE